VVASLFALGALLIVGAALHRACLRVVERVVGGELMKARVAFHFTRPCVVSPLAQLPVVPPPEIEAAHRAPADHSLGSSVRDDTAEIKMALGDHPGRHGGDRERL